MVIELLKSRLIFIFTERTQVALAATFPSGRTLATSALSIVQTNMNLYPKVNRPTEIGNYPASVYAGGGFVWDEVLEYRVWCHPENGAEDLYNGDDYYYSFETFEEAHNFSQSIDGAEFPIALILQKEYLDESNSGEYLHIKKERMTEWPVEFLSRPQRTENTILDFLNADPASNRLDILRGKV